MPDLNGELVLELRDLHKSYREDGGNALDVIHIGRFDLAVGEQTALVGASGSGKSTLLNLVASVVGLYTSYAGDWPTGAAIVCSLGAALLLVIVVAFVRRHTSSIRAVC